MRLSSIQIKDFKRFKELSISGIPACAKLVLLTGPNGSGKTSVFEAFNYWISCVNKNFDIDPEYHLRSTPSTDNSSTWRAAWDSIKLEFHDLGRPISLQSFSTDPSTTRKAFYIRSAYRHEPDFSTNGVQLGDEMILNSRRPQRMIIGEARVSENYQRIVSESLLALYDPNQKQTTAGEITDKILGSVRSAMSFVFDDLVLEGPGNPMSGGTFRFRKGNVSGFHYKNLSGGEKAAFDLLLDFIVKKEVFNDTIYCIDEPELHMHTRLQARLLKQLFELVPVNCQLWITTHSIGMARMASELYENNPGEVVFLDFHDCNLDEPVTIQPHKPNRQYWANMFATALDDLAELVVPSHIVLCEGKTLGQTGRKPSFDVAVYTKIFEDSHPQVVFLPLGGIHQVKADGKVFTKLLNRIATGTQVWSVYDKDDRAQHEIEELQGEGVQVLQRRDLESYLWDDEVIRWLCDKHNRNDIAQTIIDEKARLLSENSIHGRPSDDVKAISGPLYNLTKKELQLTGCGNDAEAFAIATLAPMIPCCPIVFQELKSVVLAPMVEQGSAK
jgi:predicted ATPase